MKKFIAMMACMMFVFAGVSCGDSSDDDNKDEKSASSSSEETVSKEDGVQAANGKANEIYKTVNSALAELDMEGVAVSDGVYHHEAGETAITAETDIDGAKFYDKMTAYLDGIKDISFTVQVSNYICSSAAVEYNDYYGTMPTIITDSNIDEYNFKSLDDAFKALSEQ